MPEGTFKNAFVVVIIRLYLNDRVLVKQDKNESSNFRRLGLLNTVFNTSLQIGGIVAMWCLIIKFDILVVYKLFTISIC